MAWTKQYTETDAQSGATDDTPLSVASLTFTPTAGLYLIVGTCEMQTDDLAEGGAFVEIVKDATTAYAQVFIRPQELTAWEPVYVSALVWLPNASQTWEMYITHNSPFANVTCRKRKLLVLRLDDQTGFQDFVDFRNKLGDHRSVEDLGVDSTTSTSYVTITSDTFTPPTAGHYLIMASTELQTDTSISGLKDVKLDVDTDTIIAENQITTQELTAWEPVFLSLFCYLTAASHTLRLQFRAPSGINIDVRNSRIVAIPLTGVGSVEGKSTTAGILELIGLGRGCTAGQIDAVSFFTFSTTAGQILLESLSRATTAGQIVTEAVAKSNTAGQVVIRTRTNKVVLVSPLSGVESSPITFVWTIPDNVDNKAVFFQIQVDNNSNFASPLHDKKSTVDSGFEYWNGSSWVAVPTTGVTSTYYGNQARIQLTFSVNEVVYWRVRGGAYY